MSNKPTEPTIVTLDGYAFEVGNIKFIQHVVSKPASATKAIKGVNKGEYKGSITLSSTKLTSNDLLEQATPAKPYGQVALSWTAKDGSIKQIKSPEDADMYFGEGSEIAHDVKLLLENPIRELSYPDSVVESQARCLTIDRDLIDYPEYPARPKTAYWLRGVYQPLTRKPMLLKDMRADILSALVDTQNLATAVKSAVDIPADKWIHSSAQEAWESLATNNLIPQSWVDDPLRRFDDSYLLSLEINSQAVDNGTCKRCRGIGHYYSEVSPLITSTPVTLCDRCNWSGAAKQTAHPPTILDCLNIAHHVQDMLVAEQELRAWQNGWSSEMRTQENLWIKHPITWRIERGNRLGTSPPAKQLLSSSLYFHRVSIPTVLYFNKD